MSCVRRLVLLTGTFALAATPLPAGPDDAREKLSALGRWLAAVEEHVPGQRDAALERIARWKNRDLDAIASYLSILAELLPEPANTRIGARYGVAEAEIAPLREIARSDAARGDVNRMMKRGALLHADIMMSGAGAAERIGERAARREVRGGGRIAVLGLDGQHEGFALIPHHWQIARRLLDAVHPDPSSDAFVRLWYAATTAFMLRRGLWGDAERQLRHARERLTPDAGVHLDSGCVYEAYAMPRVQSMIAAGPPGVRYDVQPLEANLRLAEMHFTQATVLDPTLVEARVRLARVRTLIGRAAEAVPELERASVASSDALVRYYAVLFLGQAHEALGHDEEARAAYQRAAALYPTSQSPHLSLSLLAREADDRGAAQFALRHFLDTVSAQPVRFDPWWVYHLGRGRTLPQLLARLWTALPPTVRQ